MNRLKTKLFQTTTLALLFTACHDIADDITLPNATDATPIELSGSIDQQNITRANDYGFVTGDRMGIYIVDRIGGQSGDIDAQDNRAANVIFTYDGDSYRWASPTPVYWRDRQTPIDICGYYPGVNYIETPSAYPFTVETDQSLPAHDGELATYEQSDLLWGRADNVQPTSDRIVIRYSHILAGVRVHLIKGEGFTDTEWQKLEKILLVNNTVTTSTVNLSTGAVSPPPSDGQKDTSPIRMALPSGGEGQGVGSDYRAIVIPQTVAAQKALITLTLDGQTYTHSLASAMTYEGGKLHNFTLTVNKREATGDYETVFTSDGITPWENDEQSHQFQANAYVVVHCPEPGQLEQSIHQAGYDPQTLQNMKVTGQLTNEDFYFMRDKMSCLTNLNLKDVHVKKASLRVPWNYEAKPQQMDNAIPEGAFQGNESIHSIILPTDITHIGADAFRFTHFQNTTLEIPGKVKYIGCEAFSNVYGHIYSGVELVLPYSLEYIDISAFSECGYSCDFRLSEDISFIGHDAFRDCYFFYGTFHVPSHATLGSETFKRLGHYKKLTGDVELPQGMTDIPYSLFEDISFDKRIDLNIPYGVKSIGSSAFEGLKLNSLTLPESLVEIGREAFMMGYWDGGGFMFELHLPSSLRSIGASAFYNCGLDGKLSIPAQVEQIEELTFSHNNFTEVLLPNNLTTIGNEAFSDCRSLQKLTLPKYIDRIGNHAFKDCWALSTITCLSQDPPELGDDVWQNVQFDKCILEVPEESVEDYRHAEGWNLFRNITPYHELAVNITDVTALDKGMRREGIIRAEGDWEVSECPLWCSVEPMAGSGKAEVAITIQAQAKSAAKREGKVVFQLKGKDYQVSVPVSQLQYSYGEDETIVLQQASAGAPQAVPLFIVGDGYNAEDIVNGTYLKEMTEQMEHLFSCEPFKTYRNYFTVSTAIAVSPEHGIDQYTRFKTIDTYGFDFYRYGDVVWQYAKAHGRGITNQLEAETTILVLLNTNQLNNNMTFRYDIGRTITLLGKSTEAYPYTQRNYVLHHVGGMGFGKLADEDVQHFTFAKSCTCPNCMSWPCYWKYKALGWFENISESGSRNEVPWRHLIYHPKYSQYVDIYEGGYSHARGFFRSEEQSIMSTFIPYFNTISRESIVHRIMEYSGRPFDFEDFVSNDIIEIP